MRSWTDYIQALRFSSTGLKQIKRKVMWYCQTELHDKFSQLVKLITKAGMHPILSSRSYMTTTSTLQLRPFWTSLDTSWGWRCPPLKITIIISILLKIFSQLMCLGDICIETRPSEWWQFAYFLLCNMTLATGCDLCKHAFDNGWSKGDRNYMVNVMHLWALFIWRATKHCARRVSIGICSYIVKRSCSLRFLPRWLCKNVLLLWETPCSTLHTSQNQRSTHNCRAICGAVCSDRGCDAANL